MLLATLGLRPFVVYREMLHSRADLSPGIRRSWSVASRPGLAGTVWARARGKLSPGIFTGCPGPIRLHRCRATRGHDRW